MNIAHASSTFTTTTVTVSIPRVKESLVWNFVRGTPEGTLLWDALTRWRRHYEELQNPPKPATSRKRRTSLKKAKAQPIPQRPTAYFKMKQSYPACLKVFNLAISNPEIRTHYHRELLAIAEELGITETNEAVQELVAALSRPQLELPI